MAYYVDLFASKKHGTFYLGVTNDLVRRVCEHKVKAVPGFTARYGVDKLKWFEVYDDALHGYRPREAAQEVAAGLEDTAD